ncbi:phage tail protein [Salmonella enterica subsp. enterica serovar Indiana]|uniref:Phage tail protein n=1 Tax=Salmonella enterica subsp. enterica serovar Indiana TaxID=286783 RepID=A0A5C2BIP0_SALET|nr:phage tail protein [Salmonella enterica subsp. enterica serovar Indiana]EAA2834436.1 phage tail protein [Salmonella enterica]EBG3293945.1 phage tail protein [Salmonella enterica subsp. enterica]EBR9291939.1 phage tail protein [Salmonella enterica subsp. enterica serovar Derby]ECY8687132.1 phage tail protein [Salmonella enterica subsp. enterica serovar Saintpaul]EDR6053197.1 phage tail protein [Salmonella enterica subsp. enterica serovar 4,[5],12:i:-]EDX2778599.1 phage tail protein [Salmone
MSQTAITLAFEQWKAQQGTTGEPVLLDEFVFANVPALDPDQPVDRNETLPPAEQIVHRQAVSRKGVVNDNAVVHSVVLGADVGDFSFNWIGLINKASGTLAMIVHAPLQQKLKTAEGQQGNVLTRSFLMEYNGAQAETGINTPAETWQIDFTARMAGMDERQRLENIDIFGAAAFFGDGYLVGKSGNQFYVTKGTGYVAGLRTTLAENLNITVTTRPVKVWLDVCWTGTLTSVWGVQSRITVADNLADYVQNGVQHYVFAVAGIDENGNITDLRPKGTLNEQQASDALRKHEQSRNHPDATTSAKGFTQLSSATDSTSEEQAATPKAVKIAMDNAAARLAKDRNGSDIPDKPLFVQNIGLGNVLFKGDGRFLAGTFVSDAIDRTSIGARAATGCQFMRAHQAPDAPDQVSFWQIITLSEVVSPTTVVDVLAVSGNNVLFGHGTGAGITSWRHVAMLEGGAFTGGISAPNMRGDTLVTVGDGTGGMAKGDVDGAGFNGNNLNIKSWNGIGFQNSEDLAIRAYISTRLGVIAAAENLQAGNAIFNKNGDVYGDIWGTGSGPGWLSAYIAGRPLRQYITMVGVYQNDKTKPFMLHDDGSGVFLATTDMLSGYVQSIRFGAVEHGNLYRSPGFADQLGYVITGVENGDWNDTPDRVQRRLLQLKVNGQWYTVGA